MDKYIAKEIALAYMCCNNADERNLLCHVCPWHNTENCVKTEFSEELMIKVISALKGEDMKRVKLEDIKIKNYFLNANPSDKKIEKYRKYFERNEMQLKPIIVNHRGFLTDGYIQYLVLKENDVKEAIVIRKDDKRKGYRKQNTENKTSYKNTKTTYVFGVHPNSNCKKEFVWRVPASWEKWAENIKKGDTIFGITKFGSSPVIVNKVETLSKPPIDGCVKRVASRCIKRNDKNLGF